MIKISCILCFVFMGDVWSEWHSIEVIPILKFTVTLFLFVHIFWYVINITIFALLIQDFEGLIFF